MIIVIVFPDIVLLVIHHIWVGSLSTLVISGVSAMEQQYCNKEVIERKR